jgi:hypothetical protein
MAMTHHAITAIRQLQVLPHGDKGIGFGDQHLSQHSAGAFPGDFGQTGGSGRLDTGLNTPP